ncbi:ABC transporter ATP-binding protein [Oceanobacillus halotolerans]|uniref:ABC transporter ATP-binding protein n=1 Tax=Oceanobacillus halotolerans TaxID=2663380 RepID=UPI0013DC83F4|nr:ABC transporter ATP-binding protein [Oceanobacillus halotolerans]
MEILQVNHLSKHYKTKTAVNNVQFSLPSEKCIALIGPNGAGKTTILRILAGLLKPSEGTVSFQGLDANADIRPYIGYLPQYPVFHGWMTAREFLMYSGQLAFLSKSETTKRADEVFDQVGITKEARDERINRFSGGMKQRLGIAQAIIHSPKMLILDEPVSSLDPIGRREVLTLMEKLKQEMTILFSTHILGDAEEVSDELLLLHNGDIVESGAMEHLRAKYQTTKIELGFESNLETYQQQLDSFPEVTNSHIDRNLLHVTTTDIAKTRSNILQLAANKNWPLTTFSISRATLEDMFMKVVNQ